METATTMCSLPCKSPSVARCRCQSPLCSSFDRSRRSSSLARRLTVIAYEDIGLANPDAQIHTVTALEAAQRIGFPEARILIANIVIDLALSPKSNSAYVAMDKALLILKDLGTLPIPRHLRDGHYAGSKELGNAQNYIYPHNYPGKLGQSGLSARKTSTQSSLFPMRRYWQIYERALAHQGED